MRTVCPPREDSPTASFTEVHDSDHAQPVSCAAKPSGPYKLKAHTAYTSPRVSPTFLSHVGLGLSGSECIPVRQGRHAGPYWPRHPFSALNSQGSLVADLITMAANPQKQFSKRLEIKPLLLVIAVCLTVTDLIAFCI